MTCFLKLKGRHFVILQMKLQICKRKNVESVILNLEEDLPVPLYWFRKVVVPEKNARGASPAEVPTS